ncbi:hypothetical protein JMN32_08990 [Fulvivirga sp. 29W222]|uniref:Tetratricopeptide repeat protein n=1 Tax=Fulvivirga marina TaxID=2494733 RepID=A0A937FXB3_9BACT|nr:tetratricopeptide repeat protein [Fulvivirga marina]MBL6446442.1 hypothetical protein [Fulvivirga marina]
MQSKFFWKHWSAPYKQLYIGLITIALTSLAWFGYNYLTGPDAILGWDIMAKTEHINVLIDSFKIGPFSLTTSANNTLFLQQYNGSAPNINTTSYYTFLGVSTVCIILLLTIVTTLPRFWYFVGIALFAVVLVNFKFELLLLFESEKKLGLTLALVLYLPASYFFNSIKPNTSFITRLASFAGVTAILAVIIGLFSSVDTPFLYLATYGMINPLIISLIFILIVAHEIIAAFIYLLTSSGTGTGKNAISHFYIITTIYLANLVLAYLYETHVINWDFIYVNLFLLLLISTILGIWGFRQREEQYKYLFNFYPFGAIAFLAMAICCFLTLGHFMATFNDPAIEIFRDFIIYSHLGYGAIFVIYITSNFLDPLKRNLQVYKVLYKPTSMPYFTFRLAGLIAFIAFMVKSNWEVPVNQGISAYYNGIGDLHWQNNESGLAETYYEEAAIFGYNNHKSHYMLGHIALQRKDDVKAAVYYKAAIAKNPTPQSYVNLSNIYMEQSRFFDALFALNQGLEMAPDNGAILNNIGITYAKTNIIDTAAFYLNEAYEQRKTRQAAGSNLLALIAQNDININPDSVLAGFDISEDKISVNNSFVLKNKAQQHYDYDKSFFPQDSSLSFLDASIVYNEAFNQLFSSDSLEISLLKKYTDYANNINFSEKLKLAAYLNLYKNKQVSHAFKQLNWLANTSTFNAGEYFNMVGLWALEQEAPYVAADYFKWATDRNFNNAKFNLAIALTEDQKIEEAKAVWLELLQIGDNKVKDISKNMLTVLSADEATYNKASDQQKHLYLRYLLDYSDTTTFDQLIETVENTDIKGQAILDMSKKLWRKGMDSKAIEYYGRLTGTEINDPVLFDKIQWYELKMLAAQGNIRGLSTKINQGIEFDNEHQLEKLYFTALINEASSDTTKAEQNYKLIAYRNPFMEEMTIAAANYLGIKDKFEAYNILLNGIEINPKSVKLLKAYILQCARVQLNNYAELSLEDLRLLISDKEYSIFVNDYQILVKKVEEAERNF